MWCVCSWSIFSLSSTASVSTVKPCRLANHSYARLFIKALLDWMISCCCQSSSFFVIQVVCLENGGNTFIVTTLQSIIYPCQNVWSQWEKCFLKSVSFCLAWLAVHSIALFPLAYFTSDCYPECKETEKYPSREAFLVTFLSTVPLNWLVPYCLVLPTLLKFVPE